MPTTLSDDILFLICDALDDTKDKLKFLLLNRSLYDFFLPALYPNLKFTVRRRQVSSFANSIRQNPKLRNAIRELHLPLDQSYEEVQDDDIYDVELFDDTLKQATENSGQYCFWHDDLVEGSWDAWVALLFLSLENVERLVMAYEAYSVYMTWMLSKIAAKHHPFDTRTVVTPFQRLEDVTIIIQKGSLKGDAACQYPSWEFLPFFKLPAMRVFRAEGVYNKRVSDSAIYDDDEDPFSLVSLKPQPKSSSVREIHLGDFCNGRLGMFDYITSCANLEVFEYQHFNGDRLEAFSPLRFQNALATQRHSLKVLHLNDRGDQQPYEYGYYDELQADEWFGSMTNFTQLRELRMPGDNLFHMPGDPTIVTVYLKDIIPPSLEYLYISNVSVHSFSFLVLNLSSILNQRIRKHEFQALKKVGVELDLVMLLPDELVYNWEGPNGMMSMKMKDLVMMKIVQLQKEGIETECVFL